MKKLLSFSLSLMIGLILNAQDKNFWTPVNEQAINKNVFAGKYKPREYKLFSLNETSLKADLSNAPSEKNIAPANSSFILTIPTVDGQVERFTAVSSPVMDPVLAAQYPEIQSYLGRGIDDPSAIIRFDFSPRGFHAMILSANRNTIYIDPLERNDQYYVVFSRKDAIDYKKTFQCFTPETATATFANVLPGTYQRGADDGRLRTYRLALACTGEYAQYFLDGTETSDAQRKAKVLAAMNTMMTRTNMIYERDFGIHMNLVANNTAIIYLTPSTDPWTNEYNNKTQQTIDAVIGNANYDIGHLVHKEATAANNNGNAGCIGCVCKTGSKGSAFTSHVTPEGDPFVVDYTTHEMGHQFGANHTFTFSNETGTGSQMEPGSGSTIMGYAGITGSNDVQPHRDDYFHARSIEQITDYIKLGNGGGACAVVTITGNATPTAGAGSNYTIPRSTPFTLTGTGTDADAGDVLTYCWEQYNTGTSATTVPSATSVTGPVFRSRNYLSSPSRTFPILSSVLDGTNGNKWEVIPSVARTLSFRFTARDNHAGGGNNNSANMTVTISAATGPFAVTSPNTNVNWAGGSAQTITWNVAGSSGSPVNCSAVKISLSTDGGQTFPTVLAASTPNDGSESLMIPATPTTQARVKIEAVGNIFFDISNVNFTIGGTVCGTPTSLAATAITTTTATVNWAAVSGAVSYDVDYKLSSLTIWTNAATATTATSVNLTALAPGSTYDWRVRTNCTAASSAYAIAQFTTTSPVCTAPAGLTSSAITTNLASVGWSAVSGAVSYDVDYKVASSSTWINTATATTSLSVNLTSLTASTLYDYRVRTNCVSGSSSYSSAQFTTNAVAGCAVPTGLNTTNTTTSSATIGWTAVPGALSYKVYYKLSTSSTYILLANATTATSINITGLAASSTYDWTLRSQCSSGNSAYASAQFTTTGTSTCNAPTGLASSAITNTSATVSWSAVSGAVSYDVDYKTSSSSTWINAATATTSTNVNLSSLTATTTYDWRVRTNCSALNSSYSTAQFTTTSPVVCNAPTGLIASAITSSSATVSWSAVSGAVSYAVDYKAASSSTWINAATNTTSTSVNLGSLSASTLYDYRVRTHCSSLNSAYSSAQFTTTAPTACTAPTGLNATNITTSSATVGWAPVSGAVSYKVYYKASTSSTYILLANATTSTSINITGLTASTTYDYTLRANCSSGSSPYASAQFTTSAPFTRQAIVVNKPMGVFPNPAVNNFTVSFEVAESGTATISLVNYLGQEVMLKKVAAYNTGTNVVRLDISKFKLGMYVLKIISGNDLQKKKLEIAR